MTLADMAVAAVVLIPSAVAVGLGVVLADTRKGRTRAEEDRDAEKESRAQADRRKELADGRAARAFRDAEYWTTRANRAEHQLTGQVRNPRHSTTDTLVIPQVPATVPQMADVP